MKQKLFNEASYEYMNEIMDLKELSSQYNIDDKALILGYDIILQLSLMRMVSLDGEITQIEKEFLSQIVLENDLMKIISKKIEIETTWDVIGAIPRYNDFIDKIEKLFTEEITSFIRLFISLDNKVLDDCLNRLKANIYLISSKILASDGFDPKEEDALKVLNATLFKKLDDIKSIASMALNIKIKK